MECKSRKSGEIFGLAVQNEAGQRLTEFCQENTLVIANTIQAHTIHTTAQLCSFSNARKIMLKILQASLQQYVNQEHSDVQTGFRKIREARDQIANIRWIIEKAREFQKTFTSAPMTML